MKTTTKIDQYFLHLSLTNPYPELHRSGIFEIVKGEMYLRIPTADAVKIITDDSTDDSKAAAIWWLLKLRCSREYMNEADRKTLEVAVINLIWRMHRYESDSIKNN